MFGFYAKRLALLMTPVLVFAFHACGPKKVVEPSAEEFAAYIKAYTGGIVAQDAPLRIELMEELQEQPAELFSLKPSVPGDTRWSGPSSLAFIPEEDALKPGKVYTVCFHLEKLYPDAKPFEYSISVKGKAPGKAAADEEEADNGRPFRVVKAGLEDDHIDVELSASPANANLKGMVELSGTTRSYTQVLDRTLRVFFEGRSGDLQLSLDPGLKSSGGDSLGEAYIKTFALGDDMPAVEIPLKGNILPDKEKLLLPFRAVNLSAVEVRIVKIYEKNVLMFLQENNLGGNSALRRCGRLVYHGDIALDPSKDLHKWNSHSIDLGGLLKKEPGAIYRIRLSFRQDQSLWGGKEPSATLTPGLDGKPSARDEAIWDTTYPYYWDNDYDWDLYDWEEANDPSKPSYYMDSDRFPSVQLISSDIGLMAQYAGGDQIWVATSDLIGAKPLSGVQLEVFDYQLQSIAKGKSDKDGLAQFKLPRKPFAVTAKAGGSVAYLKVTAGNERSLSRFDVGGESIQDGLKAYIYGERGVWRPGDTLHVNMILSNKGNALPEGHPATLELYTPEGQFYTRLVRKGLDGFFSYDIPTKADDPTGYWNAYFKVGGSSFHKTLHVETIKPNRLKINAIYPSTLQGGSNVRADVSAQWLSGGAAAEFPASARITIKRGSGAPFKGFEKYCFSAPGAQFNSIETELFKTRLNGEGKASVQIALPQTESAPGMLEACIVTSVEEPGGDESFTTEILPYSPYTGYVGIKTPEADYLETDKSHSISLATIDAAGRRVKGHKVEYALYRVGWSWWWDNAGGDLDAYVNGSAVSRVLSGEFSSGSADASFNVNVPKDQWGRYLVVARDMTSGHISGKTLFFDWPDFDGRASRRDPEALTMLSIATDKPSYRPGEKATVYIPAAKGGKALVSLEGSSGVLRREWVSTSEKDTPWTFKVEPGMAPNIYVHVTLLQPYGFTVNDLPIRLYGVQRVQVENPDSKLSPQIQMADKLHPDEAFTVKVSEKDGKPMTYTLAIVDEGLLDLTAFKTPDPWSRMYRPEALGVNTWDLYDNVIGAFSGSFSPLAAIGGDEDAIRSARKDNRFNPVVITLPPRRLEKGTDVIQLKLPQYVGSVRVMLVAARDGAYGNAEKTVPVTSPLMVIPTLPRVLGCGEKVSLPVNVFAVEDGIGETKVSVKVSGPVKLEGASSQSISFGGKAGDGLLSFALKAGEDSGTANITVQASGGGYSSSESIALPVQVPEADVTQVKQFILEAGQSIQSGAGTVQISSFPAIDAAGLFAGMRDYPYNCTEQISARGITLLNLLPLLGEAENAQAKDLVPRLISQLYARQGADGGFRYWPGGNSDSWVSSMAGIFLNEAAKAGYEINPGVMKAWKQYQQKLSQAYRKAGSSILSQADEAYRLYSLACAGESSIAGMNRLRESGELSPRAIWILSSTYSVCGKASIGEKLLEGLSRSFEEEYVLYGSPERDRFIALEALVRCGRVNEALAMAQDIRLPSKFSTQESAFAAVAYRLLYEKLPTQGIKAKVDETNVVSAKGSVSLPVKATVKNTGEGPLYCSVSTISRGLPKATSNGLRLEVKYISADGKVLNPAQLKQGTRFKTVIKVSSLQLGRPLENLALRFRAASGWEIVNERLTGEQDSSYDYMDIRDDRVHYFFGLGAGASRVFEIGLRAAYEGSYQLPATVVEAMYEPAVSASTAPGSATVVK